MNCIIPGPNLKVLAKALHALSKVGDELYFEAHSNKLSFITLNCNKTVCACFDYLEVFFSSYEVTLGDPTTRTKEAVTWKIHMKILLPLFRGALEKKFDYFKFEYENGSNTMRIEMKYKIDEIVMVHKLRLMEEETLSISIDPNLGSNRLSAPSMVYNKLLSMFDTSDDEIFLEISSSKIIARNHCLGVPSHHCMMNTQITLDSSDFVSYKVGRNTLVNFSLKPLRTLVHFADSFISNIDLNFGIGGKPMSMVIKSATYEVSFIVATQDPNSDGNTSISSQQSAQLAEKHTKEDNPNQLFMEQESIPVTTMEVAEVHRSPENFLTETAKVVFANFLTSPPRSCTPSVVLAPNSDSD